MDILRSKGHHVDSMKPMKEDALLKIIGDYDALVVRSATKVTKSLMAHASALKAIGRAGAGVDNIDVDEASRFTACPCSFVCNNVSIDWAF